MTFKALVVDKKEAQISTSIQSIDKSQLPEGNVTVAIEYSTVNYKDGLCLSAGGGLVRNYPHIPGIDFSGTVEDSTDERYKVGEWEVCWGGYAQKARVKADWLVPLPKEIDARQAMAVGTAGFTAMLAIDTLEKHGLDKAKGPVLVTGAAGGVGSVAVTILANLNYKVTAVTGRPETTEYLQNLGASAILPREKMNETIKRPLESEQWSGCVDSVGGTMLARVLGQITYAGAVASVGLAGGANLPATVIPFLLRGIKLLGIDSVMQPYTCRVAIWQRLAKELPMKKLEAMVIPATLEDLPDLGKAILKGEIRGRVVVDVNA